VQPIHACSSSRAILAFMDDDEIARLIPERLRRLTDRTVTTVEGLYVELRETRRRGYSICDEEMAIGITSVAVPVDIGPATGLMSLGIVGPTKRIYARGIDDIGRDLSVMVGRASPRLSNPVQHAAGVHDWVI